MGREVVRVVFIVYVDNRILPLYKRFPADDMSPILHGE